MLDSSKRSLLAIAVAGLILRIVPLFGAGGPLAWPVDYDEAVYFSSSALLFRGILPYRDFVFVHPPGLLYFLGLTSSLAGVIDPAHAFAAARVLATIVGAINIYLIGRVVMRATGPADGLVAAALYASHPEVVLVERGPYIEPVLNLACLAMALVWLAPRERSTRPAVVAGVLGGMACAVKVLGGAWILAVIASAPKGRFHWDVPRFIGAAAVTGLVLLAPLALLSPYRFIEQTLLFHAWRSPDGTLSRAQRIAEIAGGAHLVTTILAIVALLAIVVKGFRGSVPREERFFAVATLLTFAGFIASSSYWPQYNSHLAASECALAGIGAAAIWVFVTRKVPRLASPAALGVLAVLLASPSAWQSVLASRGHDPALLTVGATIRDSVPKDQCVFSFNPAWTLDGGRLPAHSDNAPVIVDSYAAMLLAATRGGVKFPDAAAAFQSAAPQVDVRKRLERCRFAVLDWRGNWQLSAESRNWFFSHFACDTPSAGDHCLWEQWGPSKLGLALSPPGTEIRFADGWFAEEGPAHKPWRWMGARSITVLPPISGAARLEVALGVPAYPATITLELDGRVLERVVATNRDVLKVWPIDTAAGVPHTLVLSTNRVFNPAREGQSQDTRDLGVRLNRIVWMPAVRHVAQAQSIQ